MATTPDRFDIDLGAHERIVPNAVPVAAAPRREEGRTLTELLADAAADRAAAPLY